MNFLQIRRLIQYLLFLYLIALTDLFTTLTRIWKRDSPPFLIEEKSVDLFESVLSAVRQAKSPIRIPKMLYPQGVSLFADHSDEQTPQTSNEMSDAEYLLADSTTAKTPSWYTEPRDETTLPKILVAMNSSNKNEAEFAMNEMVKIIEKIDMDAYSELVGKAFESFVKVAREGNTDSKCVMVLNHLPFLYSCSSSTEEFMHYGDQMLDYLIDCLKKNDTLRRTSIYATTALLERESISEDDLREKIIPTLFDLLFTTNVIEEHRNELATALCRIAQSRLEPLWMFKNFIPKFSYLLRDEMIHVKKAALSICGHLSTLFGAKFTELFIVPHIVSLIVDERNWSVRKTVCEIIVEVSHNCPPAVRKNQLAPTFILLLRDSSRWVQYQAFQELGPFISTFADSRITGLNINDKGQVVKNGTASISKKEEFHFDKLPEGVYVPRENKKQQYNPCSPNQVDEVLGEMNTMLSIWSENSSNSRASTAENPMHSGVAAKCSSVEDLTSLDFDDPEMSFCANEDDDEIMEPVKETTVDSTNQITYWSASSNIVDISDDLIAFGTSTVTASFNKLVLSNETGNHSALKNDTIHTFTEKSSDTDSFKSVSDDLWDDPLRDCRGSDEEEDEEKMDISDAEQEEVSQFPQVNHVPKDLVDNFLTMAVPSSQPDADINRYCAHNFPAVAYTLGRESWLLLKDTHKRLSNEDPRVRMSIASSLHEIGRIVGEKSTDNDLLPIFNQYKEDTPEIRYNILKNLYEFFQCLSEKKRASMINVLPEIMPVSTNNLKNDWRYRHEFVIQCRKLCNLYGNEEINRTISAIALTMANDKIAEVRTEAVLLIVEIIRRLVNAEKMSQSSKSDSNEEKMPLTSNLLKDVITSFAKTQKWSRRLTFTHICRGLLEQKALSQDQFRYFLLAQLFGMTSDKVANVRLSACKVLALLDYDLSPQPFIGEITPTVKDILKKLSNDNDMDVAREAKLTLKEEIEDKTDMALRGRKIHIKESTFFKDPNISCYDIQDMSVESEHEMPKENYEVVDMDIDEPNTSEC